jgi:hypothetical protein
MSKMLEFRAANLSSVIGAAERAVLEGHEVSIGKREADGQFYLRATPAAAAALPKSAIEIDLDAHDKAARAAAAVGGTVRPLRPGRAA